MSEVESENNMSPKRETFLERNAKISERIKELLVQKEWTTKDLAHRLARAEVERWLSGMYDFNLKTITDLEQLIGKPIL